MRVSIGNDTWWHIKAGQWMVENRDVLRTDYFSLTRQGAPWIYPGWIAQLLLYGVFHQLGFAGLNLLTGLLVVTAFAFVWETLEGPVLLKVYVILLAAITSRVYWSARPHIISFALSGYFLFVLYRFRQGKRRLIWTLPLAMIIWVNTHGGFAIGFLFIGIFLVGGIIQILLEELSNEEAFSTIWDKHKGKIIPLLAVAMLCILAVAINPHGPRMLLYPFETVSIRALQDFIQEWQSPNFHQAQNLPFLFSILLIVGIFAISRRAVDPTELLLVVVFLALALLASRNIALFALATAPVLCRLLSSELGGLPVKWKDNHQLPARITKWLNLLIFLILVIASGLTIAPSLSNSVNHEAIAAKYPLDAVDHLRDLESKGSLFNTYNWGGYIIWELYPEYLSFVDGRTDLFNDEILEDYLLAWKGLPGWELVFDTWDVEVVLVEPWAPLRFQLESQGWQIEYEDDLAIVLKAPR